MPHYYDVSYYDSFPEYDSDPEIENDEAVQFRQGDSVLVYLKYETPEGLKTVVHKGKYLYPVEGHEVLLHRIDTGTGAGYVDVIAEDLILQPG